MNIDNHHVSTRADDDQITPRTAGLSTLANNNNKRYSDEGQPSGTTQSPDVEPSTKRMRVSLQQEEHSSFADKFHVKTLTSTTNGPFKTYLVRAPHVSRESLKILDKGRNFYLALAHYYDLIGKQNKTHENVSKDTIEKALKSFLHLAIANGFSNVVSPQHIKRYANQLRERYIISTEKNETNKVFQVYPSWCSSFVRNNLLTTSTSKPDEPPTEEVDEAISDIKNELSKFDTDCIFVVEQAELFFNILPKDLEDILPPIKRNNYRKFSVSSNNDSGKRLMLLIVTNTVGLKIPIAVIGNEHHSSFTQQLPINLPFISQEYGLIDEQVMKTWFRVVFLPAIQVFTSKKVALLIDTRWISLDLNDGNNQVELIGIPANDTSKLQPLKRGIILSIQMKFRLFILDAWVRVLSNQGNVESNSFSNHVTDKRIALGLAPNLNDTATYLSHVWNSIPEHFIATSWVMASILPDEHNTILKEDFVKFMTDQLDESFILAASCYDQFNLALNLESFELLQRRIETDNRLVSFKQHSAYENILHVRKELMKEWVKFESTERCKTLKSHELDSIFAKFIRSSSLDSFEPSRQQHQTNNITENQTEQDNHNTMGPANTNNDDVPTSSIIENDTEDRLTPIQLFVRKLISMPLRQ